MEYQHDAPMGHVFVLSRRETNEFFDPFDPMDRSMPGYLYNAGHRYIREEPYTWLINHVGEPKIDWFHGGNRDVRWFEIKDPQKAMLFKLTYWPV